jgi:hypothetical protein
MQRLRDGGEQAMANGQGYGPQDEPWEPRYDPRDHRQRLRGPQGQQWQEPGYGPQPYAGQPQYPPLGQPWPQQGYQQPQGPPGWQQSGDLWVYREPASWDPGQSRQDDGPDRPKELQRPGRSRLPLYAGIAAVVAIAGGAAYALSRHASPSSAGSPAASASTVAAEPDTAAGVRTAATQFYALYSASQWGAAWAYLAPAAQRAVPAATWTAVHDGCPGPTAGLARVIKSVTFAGTTAVVAETVAGSLGNLATVSDAWRYSGGRWGFSPSASSMRIYKHGSVKADIAAAKAAGECGN